MNISYFYSGSNFYNRFSTSLKKFKTKDDCFTPDITVHRFNNDWFFKHGSPILSFKAMGSDIMIILVDDHKGKTAKHTVTIAVWNNTRSKVTAGRKVICDFPETVALNSFNEYKIFFSTGKDQISLYINGNNTWTSTDKDFKADNNGYFGFARSSEQSLKICHIYVKDVGEHQYDYPLAMHTTV
jgi:hypothetical protein